MRKDNRRIRDPLGREQVDATEDHFYDLVNPSAGKAYTIGSELARTKG